jgi:hypothetical protein
MAKNKKEKYKSLENEYLEIYLNNRYNDNNKLVQSIKDESKFFLIFSGEDESGYCRVIYPEGVHDYNTKEYYAVDPSGGPFISIGTIFKVGEFYFVVTRITVEDRDDSEIALFDKDFIKKPFVFYMEKLDQLNDDQQVTMISWKYEWAKYSKDDLAVKGKTVKENSIIDKIIDDATVSIKKHKEREENKSNNDIIFNLESDKPFTYTVDIDYPREYVLTSTHNGKSYKSSTTI